MLTYSQGALVVVAAILALRLLHRIYYMLKGHVHYFKFSPKATLEAFILDNNITQVERQTISKLDGTILKYTVLGKGPKVVLLQNGVGTGFFMWLPMLKFMLALDKDLFNKITLFVPSYRGLFGCVQNQTKESVPISVKYCVDDIVTIMKDSKVTQFHCVIGWSTGAVIAVTAAQKYPRIFKRLFLLNPSVGMTLHTAFQPVVPLPKVFGKLVSGSVHWLLNFLKPLTKTVMWDRLKTIALSISFRIALEVISFMGGFPPEQPAYFAEYMRDAFSSRTHTEGLLNLILALDDTVERSALSLPQQTTVLSAYLDVMTGVYHSYELCSHLKRCKHIVFSMGSHFILLEWPEIIAKECIELLYIEEEIK